MRGFRIFHYTEKVGGAPSTTLRLLTPLKMLYEAAKNRAEPYRKIVEELPEMRLENVALGKGAVSEKRAAYVR